MISPVRVLYVDDEPAMLDVCKTFLEMEGEISVDITCSPHEALNVVLNGHYHAVISDLQMPDMDGLQLLRAIRSAGNTTPFILFTGKGREEVAIEALNSGADFYLQKGGDPSSQFRELVGKVKHAASCIQAELALRESEVRFHSVFDNASDAMIICDLRGRVLDVNEQACRMAKTAKRQLIGQDLHQDVPLRTDSTLQQLIASVQREGEVRFEASHPLEGRPLVFTEINARLIPYGDGEAILAIVRDITDRRAREETLRKNERKYRAIFESAKVGITCVGEDGRLLDFNDRIADMLGYAREELGRLTFLEFTHPEDRFMSERHMAELRAGIRKNYELEKRYIHKDGRTVWARVFVNMVELGDGGAPIVLVIIEDITERKRTEEDLTASRLRLDMAMSMARLVDWEFDPAFGVLTVSDRFLSLYGTSEDQERGNTMPMDSYVERFVHPDERDRIKEEIRRNIVSIPKPETYQTEHRIIRADGQVRYIIARSSLLKLPGGGVKVIGANQDITEHRLREQELGKATEKLALLNSITRHDMNNQLTMLAGNTLLLKGRTTDPSVKVRIEKMEQSIGALGKMLKFTKDYQEMGAASPRWQSIREFVQDPLGFPELVGLEISAEADSLSLYADPMLPKVIYNLIENSRKYGGRPVTVSVRCEERKDHLALIIEDDGVGVPVEEKTRIFEQGYGKGTGLGLFLTRNILDITGIAISETGVPEKGARFEIVVPRGHYRLDTAPRTIIE